MITINRIWTTLPFLIFVIAMGSAQNTAMTFNIRYDNPSDGENAWRKRRKEVVELIRDYNPDFLGLQEALPKQVAYLSQRLEDHQFIGYGRDGRDTRSEASPIFYNNQKFELLNQKQLWLSETPNEISKGWDAALNRIMVYGKFKNRESGDLFHIINTHFDHLGTEARLRSAELLITFLQEENLEDRKVILMGDFNAGPDDAPIRLLKRIVNDAQDIGQNVAAGPSGTFNGFDTTKPPLNRIDYIFTKNLEVRRYQIIALRRKNGLYPSDHFPVFIAF